MAQMKLFLLFILMLFPFTAIAAIPDNKELRFQVLRNGNPFGVHTVKFSTTADDKTKVDIHIKMSVSAGPITFFEYEHFNTEIWDNNKLLSLSSETNDNGDEYFVNGKWDGAVFDIQSSSKNQQLNKPPFSSSYWHPSFVKQPTLLNTQKGMLDSIQITETKSEIFSIEKKDFNAKKYILRVNDERTITIWYDKTSEEWLGLDFSIRGQNITYKRIFDYQ